MRPNLLSDSKSVIMFLWMTQSAALRKGGGGKAKLTISTSYPTHHLHHPPSQGSVKRLYYTIMRRVLCTSRIASTASALVGARSGVTSSSIEKRIGGKCTLSTNVSAQEKMYDIMNFERRPKDKKPVSHVTKPKETRRIGAIALKVRDELAKGVR